jgi:hypothetical protein
MINPIAPARSKRLARGVRDFLTGLGLFAMVVVACYSLPTREARAPVPIFAASAQAASPYTLAIQSQPAGLDAIAVKRAQEVRTALMILGLVFASLVAFNLAFFRHLRRVYASPR